MIGRTALLILALTAARHDPLAGRTPGAAEDCIDLGRVQPPEIVDARTILYRQNARRVWRTAADGACTPMATTDSLVIENDARRLCRGDRFRVRSPGFVAAGICRFQRFVSYDLKR